MSPGKRGRPRGSKGAGRSLGPRDIPKHTCVKEVCGTVTEPAGGTKEKVTTRYWCATCHRDMGSDTVTRTRMR